ncbi:MAG TPA: tetratricopeptide repeat protein [Candidatus Binataceae bacterium]|jgi:Tfp pilus assembly protein PilF
MEDTFLKQRALELWNEGAQHHMRHDLTRAIDLYTKSIEMFPTAEAYTFRGWAYSGMGRIDDAIAECKRAIEVDPTLGNPYNDIGAYLIAQGALDEAIEWLEKANGAARYEPRHFPHMNLGRVYALKGMMNRAIQEFEQALAIAPNDETCLEMLAQLRGMLN